MTSADIVTLPSIALLGAGSMGRAILSGLLKPGVEVNGPVHVTNRTDARAAGFDGVAGVRAHSLESNPAANRDAVAQAGIVIIAVKPRMVPDLLDEIASSLVPGAIVVSVAAGVRAATFEAHLPTTVSVIRTMPNTPAVVGKAVTGLAAGSRASATEIAVVRSLFETVGTVVEVTEDGLDALGTISGSGPAYVFLLIEALTQAAIGKGFSPEQAAELANGTFVGATALLEASGKTPEELRIQVTSPKGTTERALAVLQDADLPALFASATDAALARTRELAAGA